MATKTHKQFIAWIRENVTHYSPLLGIELHHVKIEHNKDTNYLEITCSYPYLDPTIRFSDSAFDDWEKQLLNPDRILHELCHILTDPLFVKSVSRYVTENELKDERERLTDTIAAIVRKLDTK